MEIKEKAAIVGLVITALTAIHLFIVGIPWAMKVDVRELEQQVMTIRKTQERVRERLSKIEGQAEDTSRRLIRIEDKVDKLLFARDPYTLP